MATDRTLFKAAQKGHVGSVGLVDVEGTVRAVHRRTYTFQVRDNAVTAAGCEGVAYVMPVACKVISAWATTPINVTGHATTNAVWTVSKYVAGVATSVATATTTLAAPANSMTAFVPLALTVTASAVELAAGDVLSAKLSKGSTGVAVTTADGATIVGSAATITVVVEEI